MALVPEHDDWTVDDLAGLSDDYRHELINGRLLITSPIAPHQDLCVGVVTALQIGTPSGAAAVMSLSVLIDRHNQPRPDVVAATLDHADRSPIPVEDVVLIAEVLSADDTPEDLGEKGTLYASAGVPSYWIVDLTRRQPTLTTMVLDPARRVYTDRLVTAGVFETDQPWPVRLDLPALSRRYESLLAMAQTPVAP